MTRISSRQPRRQRRAIYTAHSFQRRRRMALPLSRELRARYGRRSVPVRKGDTVRILSGSFAGREERVAKVNRRDYNLTLDNVTVKTAEAKLKTLPIRTSHLLLTRLNLADAWRRRVLRVPESEAPPPEEEAAVAPTEAGPETPATPPEDGAGPASESPEAEAVSEDEGEYEETGGEAVEAREEADEEEADEESEAKTTRAAPKRRRSGASSPATAGRSKKKEASE
jgi:large subunit ribosomal protein L24